MRIAVISDIHGNAVALEAVIGDLRAVSPDAVLNLGDHVSGPLWAADTADLLMAQTGWLHIRGNHDRQITTQSPDAMGQSDHAAFRGLQPSHLQWLAAQAADGRIADVFACHGTPSADCQYLLEDVSSGFARVAGAGVIRSRLGAFTGVIACGHSHVPAVVRLDESTLVVNPGSVGLQAYADSEHRFPHVVENGSPHARYCVLDRSGGEWNVTARTIAYDWERAARQADAAGRPDWSYALRTGYVLTGA